MAVAEAPQQGEVTRIDALFDELAELQGQRNALDARIVDVVAHLEREELWAITGCRSLDEEFA